MEVKMRKKSVGVNRKGSEFFKWRSAKEDFTFAAVIFSDVGDLTIVTASLVTIRIGINQFNVT